MNILVDIGHPAHVHLFHNFIVEMKEKNHNVYVTVKDIPDALMLLEKYNIEYISLGTKADSLRGKFIKQFYFDKLVYKIMKKHKFDIGIGTSITIAHVSRITKMKSFLFDDDDNAVQPLFTKFAHPFTNFLISPDALKHERKKKNHIVYPGYHELAYLHPNKFNPDPSVLNEIGIKSDSPFFVMRFNAFKAHHDTGVRGLSTEQKKEIIELLLKQGKVFITVERDIEPEFEKYLLKLSPEKIHSLLYYATMFIGDSQTMTSEAAVLGTPAIKCNSLAGRLSIPNEIEEKYQLCFAFLPNQFRQMKEKIKELLGLQDLTQLWYKRRSKMLLDKIDVTHFMVWLIENHPESICLLKEDGDLFKQFQN
jgi:predicted glycosyltransferase